MQPARELNGAAVAPIIGVSQDNALLIYALSRTNKERNS